MRGRAVRRPLGQSSRESLIDSCPDEAIRAQVRRLLESAEQTGDLIATGAPLESPLAEGLDLLPTLKEELRAFKMKPPRIDPNDPESWREGQFDDLIFAVALTAWRASRHVPPPQDDDPGEKQRPLAGPSAWMGI